MKHFAKVLSIMVLAIVMAVSCLPVVSAEEVIPAEDEEIIICVDDEGDSSRAYELRWKYKYENGHLWKRRWNATLGEWYDPYWILVN